MPQDQSKAPAPILHTPREALRDAVRQELKALGQPEAYLPTDRADCIERLVVNPGSVLILDWELGSEDVNQILGAIKGHFLVETRPVFLVISEMSPSIIATGAEFGVSQMHSGPISRLSIRECLQALFQEDVSMKAIRETLIQVAQARSKNEWKIATMSLQELYVKMPTQERVAVELAENLIHDNEWTKAGEVLAPFVHSDPPSVRALHLMGRCFMAQGDYDAAIGLLEKAKIINPHNVDRLIDLGNACLRIDRLDDALVNFAEASRIEPENKAAVAGQGQCLLMTGEVSEALTLMKAMSGPREMASIFNTAAVLTIRAGHHEKGMALYKAALTALKADDRLSSRLVFNMGLGYKRWSKPDKAIACFQRSLELDPTYAKAQAHKTHLETKIAQGGEKAGKLAQGGFAEEEFSRIGGVASAGGEDGDDDSPQDDSDDDVA